MEYISVKKAAKKWDVSERRVHQYCKEGRILGLQRFGKSWAIPDSANKPEDPRKKNSINVTDECSENEEQIELYKEEKDLRAGAVITAAGDFREGNEVSPFVNICNLSLIRRIVITLQQAGVTNIVIVTGYQSWEIERHLANYGVIFLYNKDYETTDKFMSSKVGLQFLQDKCDKIFFTSLKIPMFMPDTLKKMIQDKSKIIIPQYHGKNGHPLLLDSDIIPDILAYKGNDGMRGAMAACGCEKNYLSVGDEGILLSTTNISRLEETLEKQDEYLLRPYVQLRIEKNINFFDERAKLLLFLIKEFHSVQSACKQMAISRGKAWDIITRMEEELDLVIVQRKQGGSRDRKTELTNEGEKFLQFFQEYEKDVKQYASAKFIERYQDFQENISKE